MKKIFKTKTHLIVAIALITVLAVSAFLPLMLVPHFEKSFKKNIEESNLFKNDFDSLIPQVALYNIMFNHMTDNQSGKEPRLLFLGYDGLRADMIPLASNKETSAILRVANDGGLFLGRTGGAKKGDQRVMTAPGWAAIFTGVWTDENKVKGNKGISAKDPIFYTFHTAGIDAGFYYYWKNFHTHNYKNQYASAPSIFNRSENDNLVTNQMLSAISGNTSAIFGVLDRTDYYGHRTGFNNGGNKYRDSFTQSEKDANRLIDAIEARETYENEDWLIIIASDHGGYLLSHGEHFLMISTVFFAINKEFEIN
ncbi:MAG: alkaline phosphatase family protein [Firmicutes bacterium]|nr:alkaline phosphatase family protein [Bacillota bacterium]